MSIRILLADDHKLIRDGLSALICSEKDMEVVAEAENGHNTVALAIHHVPDIIVMDINMPDIHGIDVTKMILEDNPGVKIIALSIHSTNRYVKEMLKAGASGYLVKHCVYEELINGIHIVMKNKFYLSSEIIGTALADYTVNFSSDRRIITYADYFPEKRSGIDRRCEVR